MVLLSIYRTHQGVRTTRTKTWTKHGESQICGSIAGRVATRARARPRDVQSLGLPAPRRPAPYPASGGAQRQGKRHHGARAVAITSTHRWPARHSEHPSDTRPALLVTPSLSPLRPRMRPVRPCSVGTAAQWSHGRRCHPPPCYADRACALPANRPRG